MLPGTDEQFNERVRAAVERRQRFESGVVDADPLDSERNNSTEGRTSVDFPTSDYSSSGIQTGIAEPSMEQMMSST